MFVSNPEGARLGLACKFVVIYYTLDSQTARAIDSTATEAKS